MHHLTTGHLLSLLTNREPPCISLYQPTHRQHPDNRQDPIRFKNLVRTLEDSLRQQYPNRDIRDLMQPFHELTERSQFWNHTRDGLAILAGPGLFEVIQTQRSLRELAVVADTFQIKPLLRHLQSADRFQVLALTRDRATVYTGNRYALDAESLTEEFPATLDQVVPPERSEQGVSIASSAAGVGSPKMVRGHGEGKEDLDTEKFFRAVDRAFTAQYSKSSGLPLLLAALPDHQALFRRVSQNPQLLDQGVTGNPGAMTEDELRKHAWQVLEPSYLARLEKLKDNYATAQSRQLGSADLSDGARAAVAGRIGLLLVEADRVIPGVIDRTSGAIRPDKLDSPQVGDMLDDLAELALVNGGEVVVVPAERMPTTSGLAAVYRY